MQKVKTKMRFTSLDIAAMVTQLQSLIGLRITNIYDVNPSTYLLKLSKSEQKSFLLIQNGIRFHIASQQQQHKAIPSGFTMKFRKYLRSKRLQKIRQVGVERVVVLTFGSDAFTNHLILQLYAQGNIILTDNNYKIIQCIRSHQFQQGVKTAVGQIYPFEHAAHIYMETLKYDEQNVTLMLKEMEKGKQDQPEGEKKKKKKQKAENKIKDVVFKVIPCLFPLAIEHILLQNNLNPQQSVSIEKIEPIMKAVNISIDFLKSFLNSKQKGYIFSKLIDKQKSNRPQKNEEVMIEKKQQTQETNKQGEKNYFQFSPFSNKKYADSSLYPCQQFKTFNEAVESYFEFLKKNPNSPVEAQDFQDIAWKKYDQIKRDQDERIEKLKQQQQSCQLKAQLIQKNVQDVDIIIKIVKTMQDNGYSWQNIERLIYESKHNGDPYANMIHKVDIGKRQVSVLLGDPTAEQQLFQLVPVQINIDYNAYTNATIYYESKKKTGQKQKRTKEASEQVLKLAEKDALKKIEKKKNEQMLKAVPTRKMLWFEKFYWFITSQGYLVISGRDSHQNQLLVKRYMKTGDLYMHSDYGGAASTIIKNPARDQLVPRSTLEQAAIFTVCRSKAWQTKIISGAWWVQSDQVSKSAPTGEFLPTGSFMIRGKRNFVYPNKMQMGMTLLYRINQQNLQKYINQRKNLQQDQQIAKLQQKSSGLQQQFAIVSYQTNIATKKTNQKGKTNQQRQQASNIIKKQSIKEVEQQDNDSDEKSEDQNSNQDEFQLKKKAQKKTQPKKGADKKSKPEQQNQPKKRVNKKKLKKLEKYLEQQDEEERQMIMKMIGAKEMKHMKEDPDEAEEDVKKKDTKVKNKNKNKKGINKYIGESEEEAQKKLDPQKVLFLQQKQQNQNRDYKNKKQQKKQNPKEKMQQVKEIKKQQIKQIKPQQKQVKNETKNQNQKQQEIGQEKKQGETQVQKQTQNAQVANQNQPPKEQNSQEDSSSEDKEEEEEKVQEKQPPPQQQVDEKTIDSQLAQLNKLVGKIHVNDKFQCLIPMCAPYPTIAENRFKIKLVPGGLKKGKAARNILHYFGQIGDLSEAQKPYVKGFPQQELINALLSSVKLTGAGLLKLQMKQKAEKKQKRKENDKKK